MTYDGDGNCQDDNGTDMGIVFKGSMEMRVIMRVILIKILRELDRKK